MNAKIEALFLANDPKDIFHFRAGYQVGRQVMREAADAMRVPAIKLTESGRGELERLTKDILAAT